MIKYILSEHKEALYFSLLIITIVSVLATHAKNATALQACTAKLEQYRQDQPKLDVGEGGFDTWESNLIPND